MKTNWNLKLFYDSINDPQIEKDILEAEIEVARLKKKWQKNTKYLTDPTSMVTLLDELCIFVDTIDYGSKAIHYLHLQLSLKQDDNDLKAAYSKIHKRYVDMINDLQFIFINISKIPEKQQSKFLTFSGLSRYKHYLEQSFLSGKYTLSDSEEKVINLLSKTSYGNWVDMLSEFVDTQTVKKDGKVYTFEELLSLLSSIEEEERLFAGKNVNRILKRFSKNAEFEINSILEYKNQIDKLRGYNRPDKSRLINDDIDELFIDTLRKVVGKHNDIPKSFYAFFAKLLGKEKLEYYERNVDMFLPIKEIEFKHAVDIVRKTFASLHPEFEKIFIELLENGQVDVYPVKSKSSGAFCSSNGKVSKTFLLLNYTNRISDIETVGHEAGHAINNHYSTLNQNGFNNSVPISMAEVASTFFEDFVLEEISKNLSEEERFGLELSRLKSDISTIFRQIACYEFEYDLHESYRKEGYLSKEKVGKIFRSHMKAYMGNSIKYSSQTDNWWVYWSHIRKFFYVYSYASGTLISKSLQGMVRKDKNNIEKIIQILSAGNSRSPKEILKEVGIDISDQDFWEIGINEILKRYNTVKELAIKLKKI